MPFAEGTVGPAQLNDGAPSEVRLTKDRSLVTQDIHGRYFEATVRGNVFTITSTGVSTLQGFASPLSSGGTSLLTLVNPANSGRAAIINRGGVVLVALGALGGATPNVGFAWNFRPNETVLTAQNAAPTNNLLTSTGPGASVMRGYGNTALGLSTTAAVIRPIAGVTLSGTSTAAIMPTVLNGIEETAGDIVVPPGTVLCLMPTTTSTFATCVASITYEEIVFNYP